MRRNRVLFLCTGNSCRSQMAEGLLRHLASDRFEVFSAGTEPKSMHPYTFQVMEEIGIEMMEHYPKSISDFLGHEKFDFLIVVCSAAEAACPKIFPGVRARWYWPFEDPTVAEGTEWEKLEVFREVRDRIEEQIRNWISLAPV